MSKRSRVTLRVMKQLYPDKRVCIDDLNLKEKELILLKRDIKSCSGFNIWRNQNGDIEEIRLSSNGKRIVESNNKLFGIKEFIKNNYKWIINTIISIFSILIILLLVACSNNEKKEQKEFENKIYVDLMGVLHIDSKCKSIAKVNNAKALRLIHIREIRYIQWKNICSDCVSDNDYIKIENRIEGNRTNYNRVLHNQRKLYKVLCRIGKDRWGNFDDFHKHIENEDSIDAVFVDLFDSGYDIHRLLNDSLYLDDWELFSYKFDYFLH